ncbi:MAG: lycopene cyclase domain-containing protein [Bacteroidota bacterium]|nr:lycopene cyclase domain-containing protein [Bacteroidota bacterium]
MPEYTLLAMGSALAVVGMDLWVLRTRLCQRPAFWITLGLMYAGKLLVNGYLTARPIVHYYAPYYLGLRLGTIPVEDFFYGFAMVGLVLVLWEWLGRRWSS